MAFGGCLHPPATLSLAFQVRVRNCCASALRKLCMLLNACALTGSVGKLGLEMQTVLRVRILALQMRQRPASPCKPPAGSAAMRRTRRIRPQLGQRAGAAGDAGTSSWPKPARHLLPWHHLASMLWQPFFHCPSGASCPVIPRGANRRVPCRAGTAQRQCSECGPSRLPSSLLQRQPPGLSRGSGRRRSARWPPWSGPWPT